MTSCKPTCLSYLNCPAQSTCPATATARNANMTPTNKADRGLPSRLLSTSRHYIALAFHRFQQLHLFGKVRSDVHLRHSSLSITP